MFVGRKKEFDALNSRYKSKKKNLVYCMEEDE